MKKKKCQASIIFSNDSGMEIVFRCEKEQWHKGKHQHSGITYDSTFILTWETFVPTRGRILPDVVFGVT